MTSRDGSENQSRPESTLVDPRGFHPGAVLIDRDRIAARVHELAGQIAHDLDGADPSSIVFMPVLVGAFIFAADLVRQMPVMMSMRLVTVSSYPGTAVQSKGARLKGQIPSDLAGRHVIVVDDILDTGQTLTLLRDLILEQKPASLRICVLLHKVREGAHGGDGADSGHAQKSEDSGDAREGADSTRLCRFRADYVGFEIPDVFVVGYGLDHDGRYRNLPDIVELAESAP